MADDEISEGRKAAGGSQMQENMRAGASAVVSSDSSLPDSQSGQYSIEWPMRLVEQELCACMCVCNGTLGQAMQQRRRYVQHLTRCSGIIYL